MYQLKSEQYFRFCMYVCTFICVHYSREDSCNKYLNMIVIEKFSFEQTYITRSGLQDLFLSHTCTGSRYYRNHDLTTDIPCGNSLLVKYLNLGFKQGHAKTLLSTIPLYERDQIILFVNKFTISFLYNNKGSSQVTVNNSNFQTLVLF